MPIEISIIVSVYNEQEVLKQFYETLKSQLTFINKSYEIIFVNDGSTDNTHLILNEIFSLDKNHVKVINFSRNFGHESAMLAGIDYSKGDIVICMDADLQHPPAKIPEILEAFNSGYEIVNMVRTHRADASFLNTITTKYFYKILNKLSDFKFEPNASDFFAISRRVADILKKDFRDRNRFIRGFIQQVGFKRINISFEAPERVGGKSKYNFYKLLLFSLTAIIANSRSPLRFSIIISLIFTLFSITLAVYSIIMKIIENPLPGYTTLIVFMSISFAILFFVIGILGEYIGNIYHEIKSRPHYIIESILTSENEKTN